MPRPPPSPLWLPELRSSSQLRADYDQANPPKYGPSSSRPVSTIDISFPHLPPSPTTTIGSDSHRTSRATLSSIISSMTSASTRTSLSAHNWNSSTERSSGSGADLSPVAANSHEAKSWSLGRFSIGGGATAGQKPRASWSNAFETTKTWFGGAVAPSTDEAVTSARPHSNQKEIKLSPSMIAASASTSSLSTRPVSSPYPLALTDTSTSSRSPGSARLPRVGTGMLYYTERNPAPPQARVQIPDPVDPQDHQPSCATPAMFVTCATATEKIPIMPDMTARVTSLLSLQLAGLADMGTSPVKTAGPLSPPPTPPVQEPEYVVPYIRVSSGEDP